MLAGRRLPPPEQEQFDSSLNRNDLIEKFSKYLEEQARLRLHQQFNQLHKHHAAPQEITGPGFSFIMPPMNKGHLGRGNGERIQFAIPPFDSRYYETSEDDVLSEYPEVNPNPQNDVRGGEVDVPIESKNKILIPPPMHVNHDGGITDKIFHRAQQKQARTPPPEVMQKPMQVEFDNTMSLYIVALIAGLSCAFSTGVSCMESLDKQIDVTRLPFFSC